MDNFDKIKQYLQKNLITDISDIVIEYIKINIIIKKDICSITYKIDNYKFNINIISYALGLATFSVSQNSDIKIFSIKENHYINDIIYHFNDKIINFLLRSKNKNKKLDIYKNVSSALKIGNDTYPFQLDNSLISKYVPNKYHIDFVNCLNICDNIKPTVIISIKHSEYLFTIIDILLTVIDDRFI